MPGPRPQINNITYVAPPTPCQTQRAECTYCTQNTLSEFCKTEDFCACHHVIEVKRGALVECVLFEICKYIPVMLTISVEIRVI